jgi:preprotein translocase subunit SecG
MLSFNEEELEREEPESSEKNYAKILKKVFGWLVIFYVLTTIVVESIN